MLKYVLFARRALLALAAVVLTQSALAQTPAPGVVHASVAVLEDVSHSYALYLPSNYSPQKTWPLLIAFDPFGRGAVPVRLFQHAAETYGFMVVGSNNSRNFADPSTAIRLLWGDLVKRYHIDARRIYTTGLSGGARVASAVAISCKTCIAAVIACDAGLPSGTKAFPESTDWFLVTGTRDFNYPEMTQLRDTLESRHAVTRLETYDGPHNWMPPEVAEDAIAWLQLRAMLRGAIPVSKEFVESEYARRTAQAVALREHGEILSAWHAYRDLAKDFRSLRDVKPADDQARAIAASDEFRKALKDEKAAGQLQDDVSRRLNDLIDAIVQRGAMDSSPVFPQLEATVNDYRRNQRSLPNAVRKNAIERGMASAFAVAVETGQQDVIKKDYLPAKDMFQAAAVIQPDAAWPEYLLASVYALQGENKRALEALRKAVDKGLRNPAALDDKDFDRLRDDPGFKDIVARLSQSGSK